MTNTGSTMVLIHGAWHGAWCFEKIIPLLQAQGQRVLAPDLPRQGVTIGLTDYVNTVLEVVSAQTQPVILLGHSLGGMIISQVAERVPEKIASLIYLAAYVPRHGQSLWAIAENAASAHLSPYLKINEKKREIDLEKKPAVERVLAHRCHAVDQEKLMARLRPQALQPFMDTVTLGVGFASVPKRAIICEDDRVIAASDQIRMAENGGASLTFLDADHSPFYACPTQCVSAILMERPTHV